MTLSENSLIPSRYSWFRQVGRPTGNVSAPDSVKVGGFAYQKPCSLLYSTRLVSSCSPNLQTPQWNMKYLDITPIDISNTLMLVHSTHSVSYSRTFEPSRVLIGSSSSPFLISVNPSNASVVSSTISGSKLDSFSVIFFRIKSTWYASWSIPSWKVYSLLTNYTVVRGTGATRNLFQTKHETNLIPSGAHSGYTRW